MLPQPIRLYNPNFTDRIAVVSVAEVWDQPSTYHLMVARGPREGKLGKGELFGPFPILELEDQFEIIVQMLRDEGYGEWGATDLIQQLSALSSSARARAALRLGWKRDLEAVEPLIRALQNATDDTCSIIDALGAIGDPRAVPLIRPFAERKLLSRRRSAVEALRNVGDEAVVANATATTLNLLPPSITKALQDLDPSETTESLLSPLVQELREIDPKLRGITLDRLYELATPASVAAVHQILKDQNFNRPYVWRYIKSIYKRSMLRHDPLTFGILSHLIESRGRKTTGTFAKIKSGYDGVERLTPIFHRKTRNYLRRLGWRYLTDLARYRPERYAITAAEVLASYNTDDARSPTKFRGPFADCYLLNRILFNRSERLELNYSTLVHSFREPSGPSLNQSIDRLEAYPELWDATPSAYIHLLSRSELPEIIGFGLSALEQRHPEVITTVGIDALLSIMRSPDSRVVQLGVAELQRRFDLSAPDLGLIDNLLSNTAPDVRQLGYDWLRRSAEHWVGDQDRILRYLTCNDSEVVAIVSERLNEVLQSDPSLRESLAIAFLDLLQQVESVPGLHDTLAELLSTSMISEVSRLLDLESILHLIITGTIPCQVLAAGLLSRSPQAALDRIGFVGIAELADHEVGAVRSAALDLLKYRLDQLRNDPEILFQLVESPWIDTRSTALEIIQGELGPEVIGAYGLMNLLDSTYGDVQNLGRALVLERLDLIDMPVLICRLAEHPTSNIRHFALELAVEHLPNGAELLEPLAWFFRAAVLTLRPERSVKERVFDFLVRRGLRDWQQAESVIPLLLDFARSKTRWDADRALEGLTRLKIAYPELAFPLSFDPAPVARGGSR